MMATESRFVRAAPASELASAGAEREQVAILVCHGMGQQVPFETIDGVARLLRKEIRREKDAVGRKLTSAELEITTRIVAKDELRLGRAELAYTHPDNGKRIDLHIYEAYWAPLTAGKVKIVDVFTFLKDAGISGLGKACSPFKRYMFDDWQLFEVKFAQTFLEFLIVLALFLSLTFMSATIVAVGAARTILHSPGSWPSSALMVDLTCDLIVFGSVAICLGVLYWWAWRGERKRNQSDAMATRYLGMRFLNWAILLVLGVAVLTAIATGALFLRHLIMDRDPALAPRWHGALAHFIAGSTSSSTMIVAAIWLAVLYINDKVRQFFVEYLGDVAAYIAPHTAHKFYEIRQEIQKCARDVARAVYSMKKENGQGPLYDRIIFMGHSLGSVVAYDTINALMLDDATKVTALQARERTSHLITFGSPLDKTAFVFREQQESNSQVREALAANVQPLIRDYRNRQRLTWMNLWSWSDPFSGNLDYYDANPPENRPPGARIVVNRKDPYCNIPIYAHTMYWQSPNLAQAMLEAITGKVGTPIKI